MAVASQIEIPPVRPEPKRDRRDRWDRYLIPDPVTGEEKSWTRATTHAAAITDEFSLTLWKQRMTAVGLAQRPDLIASAAAVVDPESEGGKERLNQIVEAAKEHAGASSRARIGDALHTFTERLDIGHAMKVPPPYDKDIADYVRLKRQIGLEISPNFVERVVLIRSLGVAGTLDRLGRLPNQPLPVIVDLKTGRDLSYSWLKIAVQLAEYAHAETVWDVEHERHLRMPQVDQDRALVIHLPAGEARCVPYWVDIRAGWEAAQVAGMVRQWRSRKDLAERL